jgi:hypothetical protein
LLSYSGKTQLISTASLNNKETRSSQEVDQCLEDLLIERGLPFQRKQPMRSSHNTKVSRWAMDSYLVVATLMEAQCTKATRELEADKEASKLDLGVAKMLLIWAEDDFSYL